MPISPEGQQGLEEEDTMMEEIWETFMWIKEEYQVVVVSDDGWSWILAWLQIGCTSISCLAESEKAAQQLEQLTSHASVGAIVTRLDALSQVNTSEQTRKTIICTHVFNTSSFNSFVRIFGGSTLVPGLHSLLMSVTSQSRYRNEISTVLGSQIKWQTIRHHMVGGLTSCRIDFGCWGLDDKLIKPGNINYPRRPLDRFLDVSARLTFWRNVTTDTNDCWRPSQQCAKPYPWPWRTGPKWVETHSVYLKKVVERSFTEKEICQLFDLRYEWSAMLSNITSWEEGSTAPIRLYTEFIISCKAALQSRMRKSSKWEEQKRRLKQQIDWGRVRAPWLGQSINDNTRQQNERILYFGWIWDSADYHDITIACKGEDAEVNLKLWAVGGDSEDLEAARTTLRNWLCQLWKRKICKEAITWYNTQAVNTDIQRVNQGAIIDCIHRILGADWWNWEQGSRLFFWQWPAVWRDEARDGAPGFHYKYPRPRLRFPQIPIQEEWIVDKDREKLEKLLRRQYIGVGECRTTVPRFPVPKGDDDIRVVWDLSKNGLNKTMYTPSFFLATMSTYLRRIEAGFYGGDFDVGEQFHNYMLHPSEQP